MGLEKFSYAKWGINEFKSGKYSDRFSQRLEISIFLINKESFFLLSLNTSTTVTKVETHNDCIVCLWHILQRNKSFFLPFLLVGPEIHNSTHSFLFYDILNFDLRFPGCYKCNSSKTNYVGCPGAFLYFNPTPPPLPHPTTRRCSRAICFLNSSYLF